VEQAGSSGFRTGRVGWGIAVILALLLAAPYVHWAARYRGDDYLITLRYARNAANGLGAVYNEGIRVQGFTSPLQFLVGTVLSFLGFGLESLPATISLLGLAGILALGANLNFWVNRRNSYAGLVVALCLVLSSTLLFEHVAFDSVWAAAFAATGLSLFWTRRYRAAGIAAALAVLSRHDAAILPVLLCLVLLHLRNWRGIRAFVIPLVTLSAPWYLFAWIYYGSPLPQTLTVKMVQARTGHPQVTWGFLKSVGYPFHWYPLDERVFLYPLALLTGIALLCATPRIFRQLWGKRGARESRSGKFISHPLFLFSLFSALHLVAYYLVIRVPASFGWYHVYFTTTLLGLAGAGGVWFANRAEESFTELVKGKDLPWSRMAVLLLGLSALISAGFLSYRHWVKYIPRDNPGRWRYEGYRAAAEWVTTHTSPSDRVFVGEIGVFGWYCPLFIYDASSLVMEMPPLDECDFRYGVWQDDPLVPPPIREFESRVRILKRFPAPGQVDIMVFRWRNTESPLPKERGEFSPEGIPPGAQDGSPD
jgi:hypothetical protein